MSEQSRKLNFVINLDTGRVESQARQAKESIAEIGSETAKQGSRMADVFKGVGGTIAATFAIGRIKSFISEIINVRSEIQSLEVSFTTLLGSETKAAELFGQIRQYATGTPMRLDDLAQGAQTMLGFNIELEKVMPMLKSIGDISMGNRERFNSLTLAFSQMSLIFSIRSGMRNAFCNLFSNKFLWGSVAFVLAAMHVVLLVPGVQALFKVTSLTPVQWIQVAGLSASAMFINEIMKLFAAMSKRLRSGSL